MHSWNLWTKQIRQNFNYTLHQYLSLNIRVYIIQQPPVQTYDVSHLYKSLFNKNELSDAIIRNSSLTLKQYEDQQREVELAFSHYKNVRGVTFVTISDQLKSSVWQARPRFPTTVTEIT
jgi:hypothetical protein